MILPERLGFRREKGRREKRGFPFPTDLPWKWILDARERGKLEYELCASRKHMSRDERGKLFIGRASILIDATDGGLEPIGYVYPLAVAPGREADGFNTTLYRTPSDWAGMYIGFIHYAEERIARGELVMVQVLTGNYTRPVDRRGIGLRELKLLREQLVGMREAAHEVGDREFLDFMERSGF